MNDTRILDMLARIDRALLAEIEVLQDGRFMDLRDLQIETANAMKGLDTLGNAIRLSGVDRTKVETAMMIINRRAEQARGLVAAALNGARDARVRLEGMVRSDGQVGAYDRQGGQLVMKSLASPYNKTI